MNEAISPLVVDTTITFNPIRVEMERGLGPDQQPPVSSKYYRWSKENKNRYLDNVVFWNSNYSARVRYSQEGAWDLEKQTQCSDDGDPEAGISFGCFPNMKLKEEITEMVDKE